MKTTRAPGDRRRLLTGSVQAFASEGLALPTGMIVAALLGRAFGPDGYGVLALAMSIAGVAEWGLAALFARATIALMAGSRDARAAGAALRWHLVGGVAAGGIVAVSAGWLADVLNEPRVRSCLVVMAVQIPVVSLMVGCRAILAGRGLFSQRAITGAVRWTARLAFIAAAVAAGASIDGAAAGSVLGAAVTLAVAWTLAGRPRPSLAPATMPGFWRMAISAFVLAMSLRLLDRIGLVALKLFGAPTADVGWYAAAQNFANAPGLFAVAFSPLLLATLTRQLHDANLDGARALTRDALRAVVLGVPLLAMLAGSSHEIVQLIYGAAFAPAADLAPPFLLAAFAISLIAITSAALGAADRARDVGRAGGPILPLAVIGYALIVPRAGALGAAVVTGLATMTGAALTLASLHALWRVHPPVASSLRALVLSVVAYLAADAWPTPGLWWLAKATLVTVAVAAGYVVLGEWTRTDLAWARAEMQRLWSAGL